MMEQAGCIFHRFELIVFFGVYVTTAGDVQRPTSIDTDRGSLSHKTSQLSFTLLRSTVSRELCRPTDKVTADSGIII